MELLGMLPTKVGTAVAVVLGLAMVALMARLLIGGWAGRGGR